MTSEAEFDQQEIEHRLALLRIHRRNVKQYQRTIDFFGGRASIETNNGIAYEREKIHMLKCELAEYGVKAAYEEGDTEEDETLPTEQESTS